MKRLLMIAYFFPPLGGGGVQRTLNLARNLPRRGWQPTILCAGPGTAYWAHDPELLQNLPTEVTIHPILEGLPGKVVHLARRATPQRFRSRADRFFWIPDVRVGWFPNAFLGGAKLLRERPFDAVYSTGGPWTSHLVALALGRRFRMPWVSDFRDPWMQSPLAQESTRMHSTMLRRLEAEVLKQSRRAVMNTPAALELYRCTYPHLQHKFTCIPNGYAEEEFAELPSPRDDGLIRLGYAGSFYPGRGPDALGVLLREVLHSDPTLRSVLRLRLMGNVESTAFHGLEDVIERVGYVSHYRALEELARCQAVLSIDVDVSGYSPFVPQKLYLYLRLGRPIFAFGGPGESDRLIDMVPGALRLRPNDTRAAKQLQAWLRSLQMHVPTAPCPNLQSYAWSSLTARMVEVLEDAVVPSPD